MLFNLPDRREQNQTLEEDLATWLHWHKIVPTVALVQDLKRSLLLAHRRGESVLGQLDAFVAGNNPKQKKKEIVLPIREQVTTQTVAPTTDFNYYAHLAASTPPFWAAIAFVTKQEIRYFENLAEAAKFMTSNYSYSSTDSARIVLNRSIDQFTSNKSQNWQAFRINQTIKQITKQQQMKKELKSTEKAIEKLSNKLDKIATELARMTKQLALINEPENPKKNDQAN